MADEAETMKELDSVTARLKEVDAERGSLRDRASELVVEALKLNVPPTEVADRSPFSAAHVRALARENNIPPARPGIKPRKTQAAIRMPAPKTRASRRTPKAADE